MAGPTCTVIAASASPLREKFTCAGAGGGGSTTISNAALLAQLALLPNFASNPLYILLSATYASQALAQAAIQDSKECSLRLQPASTGFLTPPAVAVAVDGAVPQKATLVVTMGEAATTAILEVAINHMP